MNIFKKSLKFEQNLNSNEIKKIIANSIVSDVEELYKHVPQDLIKKAMEQMENEK